MHALNFSLLCKPIDLSLCTLQTAASCKAKGAPACDIHGVDLSQMAQVRKFASDVLAKYKNVDVLVNNAGMGTPSGSGPVKGILCTTSPSNAV